MSVIPEQLVQLAASRRLIPFVGAGFSLSLGYPNWRDLLQTLCEDSENAVTFDEVFHATNGDLLQVAEYLFVKHDRQIGPIRHHIERNFGKADIEPVMSGTHVELVNLGAGQIYTTNYDDAIEKTYRGLGLQMDPVILPKDVALANAERTQVVKYHGDLAHERTLVLTESAYYQRLDFESPMDLKFRSDLLGKSVLFMGYSFRDINIRIIWFKLMQMMRDIPERDRHPSYMLMLEPNPVLEDLYAAVGLRTVVLSPDRALKTSADQDRAVADFLLELASRASTHPLGRGVEAGRGTWFVSTAALKALERFVQELGEFGPRRFMRHSRVLPGLFLTRDMAPVKRVLDGQVPAQLQASWQVSVAKLLPHLSMSPESLDLLDRLEPSAELTAYVVEFLALNGEPELRSVKDDAVKKHDIWPKVWSHQLKLGDAYNVLETFRDEISYQATRGADSDIAYLADLAKRIATGAILKGKSGAPLRRIAKELLEQASTIYPAIRELAPSSQDAPSIDELLAQIDAREQNFKPVVVGDLPVVPDFKPGAHGRTRA